MTTTDQLEHVARAIQDVIPAWLQGQANDGDLARAAIAAMQEWRPIESAPRDGTVIDVWSGGDRCANVYWGRPEHICGEAGRYCDCCPTHDGWVWSDFNEYLTDAEEDDNQPTHWQPLPPAPEQDTHHDA